MVFDFFYAMVQRKVLVKLTNSQLEKYIQPDSRYLPEAIVIAMDILKERGRIFTDEELKAIENLKLKNKEQNSLENQELDLSYDKNIVDDPNAIALFPLYWIVLGSVLLTTLFGSILLIINLIKLKKYIGVIVVLLLSLGYFIFQENLTEIFTELGVRKQGRYSVTPDLLSALVGACLLLLCWLGYIPETLKYRQANIWFPIFLALILSILIYFNFLNFSLRNSSTILFQIMNTTKK